MCCTCLPVFLCKLRGKKKENVGLGVFLWLSSCMFSGRTEVTVMQKIFSCCLTGTFLQMQSQLCSALSLLYSVLGMYLYLKCSIDIKWKKYLWKNIKIFYILSISLSFSFSMMVFLFDLVLQINSVHSCVTIPVYTIHCWCPFFLLLLNDSLPPLFLYSFKSFQGLLTYFQIKRPFLLLCHSRSHFSNDKARSLVPVFNTMQSSTTYAISTTL